ncbi:MAG: sugar phosphate isomerase/epimerase [Verrucomicrobia bacterium CG_4_10_14_3_um_filter_43_23]|nr:MAG: hypothetical protein AUJ82_08425 [Verrucomicrobia bacterium CG1_02_43_26]PIX58720.1 MAG: sugar phosphate isomerase/epimerase [Verrucomicrobia bacterium CG_4_10_14_3_um_filter_43_23]PIY62732.1 MAG: sugar phosphate isomerase/epimerase [Verrucomicrobia bacterium CG_4_10_14_0_8_um_filter_43_34]PJA44436.1 MAG: sugar phosphate isomerase/epimerase [Verrucomicrobia bacterium CG_4_9_14_3_um_filter_43_20]
MDPIISLSTCWLSHRHTDGYQMLTEVAEMGFEYVELSHGIRLSLVPGVLKAVEEGVIKVSSVHNFCPLPAGVIQAAPNLFQPSSGSLAEQNLWFKNTLRTLEFSMAVNAKIMVAHMGSVTFFWSRPDQKVYLPLKEHGLEKMQAEEAFMKQVQSIAKKAKRKSKTVMKRVYHAMERILPIAREMGVKIAIENRDRILEIPLAEQEADFLEHFAGEDAICGWHDSGHAKVREQLGLIDHEKLLEATHKKLIGFHLKDVTQGGRDDQPIGSGVVDFEMISKYFREGQALVIELGPNVPREGVISSKQKLEELIKKRFTQPLVSH